MNKSVMETPIITTPTPKYSDVITENRIALEPNVLQILKDYRWGGVKFNDILESFIDANLLNERGKQLYHETWEMYYHNDKNRYDARMKKQNTK